MYGGENLRVRVRPDRAVELSPFFGLPEAPFNTIARMVGAGALVKLLLAGNVTYNQAVIVLGILMIVYVVFGGMLATTWVQIVKAILLMAGTILLSILVRSHFHFSFGQFFGAISQVTYPDAKGQQVVKDFLQPGLRYKPPYGPLEFDFAGHGADF
jgi:cation/acetate symporter